MPANRNEPGASEFGGRCVESGPIGCITSVTIADPPLQPLTCNATGDQTTQTQALGAGNPAIDFVPTGSCAPKAPATTPAVCAKKKWRSADRAWS